ncbi:hypothetical protein DYI23_04500 [Roseibium polysiphoniae]|uniref:Uncharacterized protein n=1 Tax=Roseibium polysiphoniae TaxID=2571221 RepID=A0A944CC70_9HYPH|nr:hypothetical protein [Roseibium polysiphoniae]MBS8259473.1 hypothetical protein [Roseibium polysiphoniae]
MIIKNEIEINRAISYYREEVERHGLFVEEAHDFELLAEICARRDEREGVDHSLTEQFSPKLFDFSPDNAFFLLVRDADGEVASVQGARLDHLSGISLAGFWQTQQRRIYCDPYPDQVPELGQAHCPEAFEITGKCVYHGNMWLTPAWKGKRLGQPLCRLGQLVAYAKWPLDYIYCFIESALVSKGFAAHQGYAHISPTGTDWIKAPEHIHGDDYLCWNRPRDLDHLARTTNRSVSRARSYSQ